MGTEAFAFFIPVEKIGCAKGVFRSFHDRSRKMEIEVRGSQRVHHKARDVLVYLHLYTVPFVIVRPHNHI